MPSAFEIEIAFRALCDAAANRRRRREAAPDGPVDLVLCIVDHFEPRVGGVDPVRARRRLKAWIEEYPRIAERHRDADGRRPGHSFFYPWDEYDRGEMVDLQAMCSEGFGEVEIHLHHSGDTEDTLRATLTAAITEFRARGALSCWPDGQPAFGFIHGNWALDNSRHENGADFCGVDSEIRLLRDLGCYADFTFPAWQQDAQPRITNAIYYAVDDPNAPKSHDRGMRAAVGGEGRGDLLLVQGALIPFLDRSGGKIRPAVDDSDLAHYRRYSSARADRWIHSEIHVTGCPNRLFVKLHCHGAADANRECLLGSDLEMLFSDLEGRYNDGARYRLHYVTAREMFNIIRATETDPSLSINEARDFVLKPPAKTVDPVPDGFVQPIAERLQPAGGAA